MRLVPLPLSPSCERRWNIRKGGNLVLNRQEEFRQKLENRFSKTFKLGPRSCVESSTDLSVGQMVFKVPLRISDTSYAHPRSIWNNQNKYYFINGLIIKRSIGVSEERVFVMGRQIPFTTGQRADFLMGTGVRVLRKVPNAKHTLFQARQISTHKLGFFHNWGGWWR